MPINPQHYGSFTLLDNSGETSNMQFYFGPVTALTIAAFLAEFGDLRDATAAITLGNIIADQWVGDKTLYTKVVPSDVNAQRERKAMVSYQDDVTFGLYRIEIPTIDLAGRMQPLSDLLDLTQTEVAAWVTAFEQLCRSPEGNPVTVLQIRAVGRAV